MISKLTRHLIVVIMVGILLMKVREIFPTHTTTSLSTTDSGYVGILKFERKMNCL